MDINRSFQHQSETFIVASANSALASGTLIPSSGDTVNLANGQIGVVSTGNGGSVAKGTFITAGQTITNAPEIRIVQGTPKSTNVSGVGPYDYSHKAFVETPPINGSSTITFTGKIAGIDKHDSWIIGTSTTANAIKVLDNQVYALNIGFAGTRQSRTHSTHGLDTIRVAFETLDYTTLGTVSPLDHLVKNLCFNANLQSRALSLGTSKTFGTKPFVAFAVNMAGGAGVTLTNISTAVTTSVPVLTHNSITHNVVFTTAMQKSIADVITNTVLTGASTIEVINRTTAGAAASADVILLMALDEELAIVDDRIKDKKVFLKIGYADGFNDTINYALNKEHGSFATEGQGNGRILEILYKKLAANQVWSQQVRPYNNFMIEPPQYIDNTEWYSVFTIETNSYEDHDLHVSDRTDRHKIHILIPADEAAGTTSNATLLTSLNAILSPWLNSVYTAGRMPTVNTPATLPAFFL